MNMTERFLSGISNVRLWRMPMAMLVFGCFCYFVGVSQIEPLKAQVAAAGDHPSIQLVTDVAAMSCIRLMGLVLMTVSSFLASRRTWLPVLVMMTLMVVFKGAGMQLHAGWAAAMAFVCAVVWWSEATAQMRATSA